MHREFDPLTLRLFVAICEEGNIARAAAREALVASAVSKRIAAVEAQIGAPLLLRGRRDIALTAAGEALLRQARQVLALMAHMHAELSDFASGVQGSVRVVASPSVLAESLASDIGSFLRRHPAVRVSLDEDVSAGIVRAVRAGAADIGVLWDATATGGLQALPYRSDHMCVAMPAGHRWARRRRIAFTEALDDILVGVAPGGTMDTLLRREAAKLGRTPAWRIQVASMDAAARIVAAGLGPAVLPREAVQGHAAAAGLALVPLADAWAVRRFVVCLRADGSAPATTRLLAEHLAQVAAAAEAAPNPAAKLPAVRREPRC